MYQYLLSLVLILVFCNSVPASLLTLSDCYANDSDPYFLFSSKTSYFIVDNENVEPIVVEGKNEFLNR